MILCFYNILFTLFLILYIPYSLLRCLLRKRLRQKLAHRMGGIPNLFGKRPVWIHAASVGEVICSIPLLKKMKKEFPEIPILVTTMTQTGNDTARKLIPEAAEILFFPLDHPIIIRRAIRRMEPSLLLIAETELWPNLLRLCEKKQIPVLLFNGRISERSLKGYLSVKSLFRDCLKSVTLFLMQTEEDRSRIVEIGAPPIRTQVMGNLKFDQTFPPVTQEERESMAQSLGLQGEEILLIAGSTHAGEEEILFGLFKELKRKAPNLFLILAPRHLDRLEEVEKILKEQGLPWVRKTSLPLNEEYSDQNRKNVPPVILLDTMGELMRLYSLGTLVFIGGSLVPIGGHNPLEPLAFKKCVLFGPYMFNFSEISKKLVENGGAIQVTGKEDLSFRMKFLLSEEKKRREIGEKGYQFLQKHRGAIERAFEAISPYLTGK